MENSTSNEMLISNSESSINQGYERELGQEKKQSKTKQGKRGEIKPLTTLRAVAAALVFFYHFVYLRNPIPTSNVLGIITQNGFIGVNLLFVLSGFVLAFRYYGDVEQKKLRLGDYIKRRAARLYPLYFLLLAAIVLLGVPINIANATITQGFFSKYFETGIINTWSLSVEECFYFVLPILLWVLVRNKSLWRSAIVLVGWTLTLWGIGYGLILWSNVSGLAQQTGFMDTVNFALYRTFFGYGVEFSIGIFGALLYRKRGSFGIKISSILAFVGIIGIAVCMLIMTQYPTDWILVRIFRYVTAVFAGMLIYALTCERMLLSRLLALRPLVYMGRLSYGLYLVQLTQVVWFMADWPVVLFYVGCNVVSAILHHTIEEPARDLLLKRWIRKPSVPALPAVPASALSTPPITAVVALPTSVPTSRPVAEFPRTDYERTRVKSDRVEVA